MKNKLIRITTVPISLEKLLENQLRFMKKFYEITAISSGREELEKFGENQGVNTYYINLSRKITPIKDLKAVFKLYLFLKKYKPQIIHTHTPKAGIVGMLSAYFAKVPNRLHTVAGLPLLEAQGVKRRVLNFVEKVTYKCATKVYPNSYGLKNIILENRFTNTTKLKVIANGSSNGINTTFFNPVLFSEEEKRVLKDDLKFKKDDFIFIFVGRLVKDKGINELVEVFCKLSKENKKIKLLLVGSFEKYLDPLKVKTIERIKLNKQIVFVGFQQDVRPYFAISNVLVFPSYREGFPNVVLQAGAMGLPSVVSDINGCNEIIEHKKNGLIIPVKDTNALYNAMLEIMKSDYLCNKVRKTIKIRFEQEVVWDALLSEYNKLLEKNV